MHFPKKLRSRVEWPPENLAPLPVPNETLGTLYYGIRRGNCDLKIVLLQLPMLQRERIIHVILFVSLVCLPF